MLKEQACDCGWSSCSYLGGNIWKNTGVSALQNKKVLSVYTRTDETNSMYVGNFW